MNFSCVVNLDRDNLTPYVWITHQLTENGTVENAYVCATFALIVLLFGMPLNVFVTLTILYKKLYKSVAVIPMLSLAICNLLVCLFILPFVIISGYSTEFLFGSSDYERCMVCSLRIANVAFPFASVHTMALMSVGRFLYLKKPLLYHLIMPPKKMTALVIVIWIYSIIISLPPLIGFGSIKFSYAVAT